MPPAVPSPILRRRRLGTELRRFRELAGLTGDQVIDRIGWASASKLSRLENGRSRPDPEDVRILLDLYGVDAESRDELLGIAQEAGDMRGWLLKNYPVMTPQQRGWAEIEAGCAAISEYNPVLVPGLLQTPGYARLRILSARQVDARAGDPEPVEDAETEVQARLARQSLLTRPDAPRYTAVLEEAALGHRAGPPEVLREQLAHLCELALLPNVTLHLLHRDTRIADCYLPPTAFSLYRFADPQDPETLAIEGGFTDVMSTEVNTLNRYKVVFEWLCSAALSEEDTITRLFEAAGRLSEAATPSTVAYGSATAPVQRRPSGRLTDR
ncbi:helix-turn-helix domain-containing protein [Micromonospora sp. PLK6-60]|uniref:helix-turn-helix domain-containing protein n=1 Tax=Micromonospora sp. PLK6-60 TaxID=2873383 RepID=UPI001CA712A9|nr:helix-turn-helix transcriptional regulator [Micromonospora sp. PLK6-60]MBY8874431.1 helix-turn-helix domain-containing protein [Micromonospora sp. PLK6-60]